MMNMKSAKKMSSVVAPLASTGTQRCVDQVSNEVQSFNFKLQENTFTAHVTFGANFGAVIKENTSTPSILTCIMVASSVVAIVWTIGSTLGSPCSVHPFNREQCECSVQELFVITMTYYFFVELPITLYFAHLIGILMGSHNLKAQGCYVLFCFGSLCVNFSFPVFMGLPSGVVYGFYLAANCTSMYLITTRIGHWKDWKPGKPLYALILGFMTAAGVVVGGQQVLYLIFPAIKKNVIPYISLVLALLEYWWVVGVSSVLEDNQIKDDDYYDSVSQLRSVNPNSSREVDRSVPDKFNYIFACSVARILISVVEGLRTALVLAAIVLSDSVTDSVFVQSVVIGVVTEALSRNKVFAHIIARQRGKPKATWGKFKRIVNSAKYDSNYTALVVTVSLLLSNWCPYPLIQTCDDNGHVDGLVAMFTPEAEFLVCVFAGDIAADVLTYALQCLIQWLGITQLQGTTLYCAPANPFNIVLLAYSCLMLALIAVTGGASILGVDA